MCHGFLGGTVYAFNSPKRIAYTTNFTFENVKFTLCDFRICRPSHKQHVPTWISVAQIVSSIILELVIFDLLILF